MHVKTATRLVVLMLGTTGLGLAGVSTPAQAFTAHPFWKCRASADYESINGANRVEPVVANGNPSTADNASPDREQCANETAGADNLATPLDVPTATLSAQTASATTTITPETGLAIDQNVDATSRVENLGAPLGGASVVLGVGAANATATGSCVGTSPKLDGTSQVTGLTINGVSATADGLLDQLQQALAPLGAVATVQFNEQVRTSSSLVVRALHVQVLPAAGGAPLADVVVAESKVDTDADVCDADKQIPGLDHQICPTGSRYDTTSGFCIIPASATNQLIVVGPPFEGPSGGVVVPLDVARAAVPGSYCLKHPGGKQYAVLGSAGADRITGTNGRDLILSLGGNDSVAAGRGADCIEGGSGNDRLDGGIGSDRMLGGTGNDTMTGDLDNDTMDGGTGNDKINGGAGSDTITGDAGRDIIQTGFGTNDRVNAGSGDDVVNAAIQGPPAHVNCGTGKDKIRLNAKEQKTVRNCEIKYVLKDK